jgi:UDP-N-acetylmuramoylalanine--D-glutamate ligase
MAERAGIRVRVGGNLGTPALDLLSETPGELYVLELSSYQLETSPSLRVKAATVLNVTADHLDRYAGMAEYAAAKANVFRHCGTAVINVEDDYVRAMPTPDARRVSFALATAADYRAERRAEQDWLRAPDGVLLAASELRIRGRHNLANALAAVALADACELPRSATLAALRDFAGLPHRTQWVRELRGVSYVNDSKGTNVGATLAAVEGFAGPLRIIAGGDGKNQDFAPLAAAFRGKVRSVHLIGRDAPAIAKALNGICPTQQCADLPAAVSAAAQVAQSGDTVLLSPACASLDMFRDYTHRGEVFMRAVAELAP